MGVLVHATHSFLAKDQLAYSHRKSSVPGKDEWWVYKQERRMGAIYFLTMKTGAGSLLPFTAFSIWSIEAIEFDKVVKLDILHWMMIFPRAEWGGWYGSYWRWNKEAGITAGALTSKSVGSARDGIGKERERERKPPFPASTVRNLTTGVHMTTRLLFRIRNLRALHFTHTHFIYHWHDSWSINMYYLFISWLIHHE